MRMIVALFYDSDRRLPEKTARYFYFKITNILITSILIKIQISCQEIMIIH